MKRFDFKVFVSDELLINLEISFSHPTQINVSNVKSQ